MHVAILTGGYRRVTPTEWVVSAEIMEIDHFTGHYTRGPLYSYTATMFRPRPNAAGGPSKDGGNGNQPEVSASSMTTDASVSDTAASLPTGAGDESFITRMMADK